VGEIGQLVSKFLIPIVDILAAAAKDFSGLGQGKGPAGSVDQLEFELLFNTFDLLRHRRLADKVSRSGLGKAPGLRKIAEDFNLIHIHIYGLLAPSDTHPLSALDCLILFINTLRGSNMQGENRVTGQG
jgi:hypothetical protein